jgi:SNF2-related domain/Helicase conserved C-terminal domain
MITENYSKIEKQRQKLAATYQSLVELDQSIVQLFSVIYTPVSRNLFFECFQKTKLWGLNPLTAAALKPYLDRLITTDLLISSAKNTLQINPLIAEIATRTAITADRFTLMAQVVAEKLPIAKHRYTGQRQFEQRSEFVREVRLGLYLNDTAFIDEQFTAYYDNYYSRSSDLILPEQLWLLICNNPFDADWIQTINPDLAEVIWLNVLGHSLKHLTPAEAAFAALVAAYRHAPDSIAEDLKIELIEQLLLRGQLATAKEILDSLSAIQRDQSADLLGWWYFLKGEDRLAISEYQKALKLLKKESGKRKIYFYSISGLFYILALLRQGDAADLQLALDQVKIGIQDKTWLSQTYYVLESTIELQQGQLNRREMILNMIPVKTQHSVEILIRALCIHWADKNASEKEFTQILEKFYSQANDSGYHWLAMEAAGILAYINPTEKFQSYYQKQTITHQKEIGIASIVKLIQPKELWELSLNALTNLQQKALSPTTTERAVGSQRLAWAITFYGNTSWMLQPREQIINVKGEWSKGRNIALKRLKSNDCDYLTPQDVRVCGQLKAYGASNGWGSIEYRFDDRAIIALIGHPLVFWENNSTRIEIVKGEPELTIKSMKGDKIVLEMNPKPDTTQNVMVVKESPSRLKAIEITDSHRRIADILGVKNRLEVPAAAKERVLTAIGSISQLVTVHSDIGGGAIDIEEVPSDPQPHIHLIPIGSGLKLTILARPFAPAGPYYSPGKGGATVIADIDGKRLQTNRDLAAEGRLANTVIAACPVLEQIAEFDGEWSIEDPELCLELLVELQALADVVTIEWPEGEKMRVSRQKGLSDFKLKISRENDWFATSGEIKVNDNEVMELQQLLGLLDQTPGRFIPLGDGQFLALTKEFRQRLDELRLVSTKHGKKLGMHPLAALSMEDWIDEVGGVETDKYWKSHIKKLREIEQLEPELPSTLQAELRDYQLEGFRWLARLAHWGVGACLADDMGLGKTLQSIAAILTRAAGGATLVIAPTSVCMNWISEAEKFAPTLNPMQFGAGDRQKVLDGLQPLDLVVCSYGLLQQEDVAEMLAKITWQTIVLDEAQSIKNFATKRSQAAMNLQAGFKIIATGTPIENHLGELWNLFRFINPGLLGSLDDFNTRFANAIERSSDAPADKLRQKNARLQLKKLIQPFILRRLKQDVLTELPSRTEITLQVELSKPELLFYEALRQKAIAKLTDNDAPPGQKHLQVLAEIMKLRRACCNPKLVTTDIAIPSAKLKLFGEVLAELLENKHKALVFSQFVDHLHILREYLDGQNIPYQYLDGSTTARDRKQRVDAFQAGVGDVFLISLKAGGTGLNLTAADYVIHMDPWWNPAVEDQASDRTHRIGQKRPVTIYRLVAQHTIEEKIVDMHKHKRDLADSLLEGSDMSGKVSTNELLRLINE